MASYLRPRRGTASAASAIVLKKGEIFCEFKNNPATTSGGTSCGAIKMGNGTTSYQSLGYFLNPDTDVVTWAATTAEGQPADWGSYGGTTATSATQGPDFYDDLNALVTGSQNKKVLPLIKNLLFKLATQVTTLNNDYLKVKVFSKEPRFLQGYDAAINVYLSEFDRINNGISNYTLLHIDEIYVTIGSQFYHFPDQIVSVSGSIGNNFYVYAKSDGTISVNTNKTADSNTSTLIGGFHWGRIRRSGTVSDVTIGIIPNSVWTINFRPVCNPDAMVYIGAGKFGDIYLTRSKVSASNTTGGAVYETSAYGAIPCTGYEGYCQYTFVENLGKVGKRLASHEEFIYAADGSPQGLDASNTNAWTATSNTTRNGCGYVAYAVSYLNICDLVGNVWKWNRDYISNEENVSEGWGWKSLGYDPKGQGYMEYSYQLHALVSGGSWNGGSHCGSRAVVLGTSPWYVDGGIGAWAVSSLRSH